MSSSAFKTSGSRASDPEPAGLKSVSLTVPEAEPGVMLKLNCLTPHGAMEGDDSDIGEAGEGENLFKSRLVQSIGIPQYDTLKSSDSNGEFIPNILPSFGRADVYPSKFHDGLNDFNSPTNTEKNYMTNSDAEQLK